MFPSTERKRKNKQTKEPVYSEFTNNGRALKKIKKKVNLGSNKQKNKQKIVNVLQEYF